MVVEPEPKGAAAELAIVEETPVEALASDSATIAVVEESAVTARADAERWPRLPRIASPRVTPRATPAEAPREFVFVSGASVVLPPSTASEPARRRRRRRRRRKPKGVSPLASPTSSLNFPDWASPTSSIASSLSEGLSSPWSSPRPHLGEQHHFPRGDSSSSSFWSSTSSLWSSTTSAASWASSSASSLLSFAAAPAQGDGPDHYRPDSPDDFRVACRDVSMPLPE